MQRRDPVTLNSSHAFRDPGRLGLSCLLKRAMGNSDKNPVTPLWARETPGTQSLGEDWVPVESRRLHEAGGRSRTFAHIPGSSDSAGGQAHRAASGVPRARRPFTPSPSGTWGFGFPPQDAVWRSPLRPPPARALSELSRAHLRLSSLKPAALTAAPPLSPPRGRHHREAGRRPERLQPPNVGGEDAGIPAPCLTDENR